MTAPSLKHSLAHWTGLPSIERTFEPRMTRTAASNVEKLFGDLPPKAPSTYDLRTLHREVEGCWRRERSLDRLETRDLRRVPWILFYPPRKGNRTDDTDYGTAENVNSQIDLFSSPASLAGNGTEWLGAEVPVIREYGRWLSAGRRTRSVLALLHEFLRVYPLALPTFRELCRVLQDGMDRSSSAPPPSLRRWRQRCRDFGLLEAGGAGAFVQKLLSAADTPEDVLCQAGLDAGLARCGFLESGIRARLPHAESLLKDGRLDDLQLRRLLTLLEEPVGGSGDRVTGDRRLRFDDGSMRRDIATALLRSFAERGAERETRERLQPFFLGHFGDPRLRSGKRGWAGIPEEIRRVVIRWLNEEALEQFIGVVKETALDQHWVYREAFWRALLPLVSDAWFVLGRDARAVLQAMNARSERPQANGSLRGAQPDQSVLLLRLPGVTVAEWSHNGSCRFWLEGSDGAPRLYATAYSGDRLRHGADHAQRHDGSEEGRWQDRIMAWLRINTSVQIDRSEYFPARRRRHRHDHGWP